MQASIDCSNAESLGRTGKLRSDILNKKALRAIRKHYYKLFKKANKKMVRHRLCNASNLELNRGMMK